MSTILKIQGDANDGVRAFLRHLLENQKLDAIIALGKTGDAINYLFVTDSEKMNDIFPMMPVMPQNAARLLSQLTRSGPLPGKVGVMLHPCELNAFVELVKREQAVRDNLIFISPVCGGVLTFESYKEENIEEILPDYWKTFAKRQNYFDIRRTCAACEQFIPVNADITVIPTENGCELYLNTPTAEELAKGAPGEITNGKMDEASFGALSKTRKAAKEKLFEQVKIEDFGIKGLIATFGRCIGCHGCSSVCPICYCGLCAFQCKDNEFTPAIFESELSKRGAMRVPPNTVFYHLGRIAHMGISCIGCGMCSDVCPADVPVSSIFMNAGQKVQAVFDYLPGKSFDEPVPLSTFIENELTEVED